ncbi:hypothetical protein [Vibrio parahaemolyticus]|uniref:hypothetical protein n=1 Tax=Vibrio parahaemolyticus TaxID=670 RepID=UPI00226A95D3|nr:hypothetical protein [Vibrio parahaemolyticus]MCX8858516.1 hypothetical protein [Vibrio parahaemolyticus]MCX8865052.1 hypothetical protein [Vibrio parahaemolyticus]MCX8869964.1 hypothetical protein [Vibrio parahaemolyticus]MCX8900269.1 hypothetical protein [Vibrio parahaemolyticus]MCX8920535.1 hypothetical protein [Vibrio parahaemolyticus]
MKVNSSISSLVSAPLTGTENHTGNQGVVENVTNLEQALSLLESDSLNVADLKTLSDTVNNQRSALNLMSSRNAEADIANSLQDSINDYAKELELLGMWVEGGKGGFYVALDKIANNLFNQSTPSYEDIFQVALIDVLINAADYGLENDVKFMQYLSWCIEYIGTGQHNTWIDDLPSPPSLTEGSNQGILNGNLTKLAKDVWSTIYQKIGSGDIPKSSLAYKAMNLISGGSSVSSTLPSSLENKLDKNNYFSANSGGWITTTNNNMSPMMRLMLLTQALGDDDLSKAELETILTGTLQEVNNLTQSKFQKHPYEYILAKDPIWQNSQHTNSSGGVSTPNGVNITLDYNGKLNQTYLTSLYQNHPSRVLGDDEITDINRIGDTVKMIQQTLKYWIQIMRDERMAVARNI